MPKTMCIAALSYYFNKETNRISKRKKKILFAVCSDVLCVCTLCVCVCVCCTKKKVHEDRIYLPAAKHSESKNFFCFMIKNEKKNKCKTHTHTFT